MKFIFRESESQANDFLLAGVTGSWDGYKDYGDIVLKNDFPSFRMLGE